MRRSTDVQGRNGITRATLVSAVLLVLLAWLASQASPQATPAAAPAAAAGASTKLVFLVTTGLEDTDALQLALEYSIAAKQGGHLTDVVVLADGRGVELLASHMHARPEQVSALARRAHEVGVRFIVSSAGMNEVGMTAANLDPKPDEIVTDGGRKLAELISQHFEVIHF